MMKIIFKMEKATKNTIKFAEVLGSGLATPKIGSIYVPKATLGELEWEEGDQITIELSKYGDI